MKNRRKSNPFRKTLLPPRDNRKRLKRDLLKCVEDWKLDPYTGEERPVLIKYAWPGGYTVIYVTNEGETICPDCAQKVVDEFLAQDDDSKYGWPHNDPVLGCQTYDEGPDEDCAECSKTIESSYGDPDEPEEEEEEEEEEGHVCKFGPFERSPMAGTPHRKCLTPGCKNVSLDDDDDEEEEERKPNAPRRKKNSYNGWKNRETWNVVLWIMNDEGTYKEMRRAVRSGDAPMTADDAQEFVEEMFPDGTPDMKDIATEVAYKRVDWEAVAEAFNEEWEEPEKDEEEADEEEPEEEDRKPNGLRRSFDPPPPPPPPRPTYTTPQKMRLRYDRGGKYLPAWDVKVRRSGVYDRDEIAKHFKCDKKTAQKAVDWAWESTQERWWEGAQESAEYHLGDLHPNVKSGSDGRSGGWCVLTGLPDIFDKNDPIEDIFDAETLKALAEFEKDILGAIDFHLDDRDGLEETIEANGWCDP